MKLIDMQVKPFSDVLASDAPAPGGGSTAALSGALGAALTHMVCALTVGKKKYEAHDALMREVMAETETLRAELLAAVDRDTEAFDGVTAAFALPKNNDAEIESRKEAVQQALQGCVYPPLDVMRLSLRGLTLAQNVLGNSNESALSDLGVSVLALQTALQGAWLNVLINVGGLRDKAFADARRQEGETLLHEALPIANAVYTDIVARLS